MPTESKYPNCCPFCGIHVNRGGVGQRHGVLHCSNCHADYDVTLHGTYGQDFDREFDEKYKQFLESAPNGISDLRRAFEYLDQDKK